MKKTVILTLSLAFFGCIKFEDKQNTIPVETAADPIEVQPDEVHNEEAMFDFAYEVKQNLIRCENDKYLIRVDRLTNDDYRYLSWNKPKTETDMPDMVLKGPEIERQGTGGGYVYTFKTADGHKYIVEDNQMGETDEAMGRFLRVEKGNKVLFRSKMTDLPK